MIPGRDGGARFAESFGYAWAGIRHAAAGRNFRVQSAFAAAAVALGAALGISAGEWCAVAVCIALVLGGECVNTAVEDAVDLASPQMHPLAKGAKDAAAGAVLVFSAGSLAVGAIVFLPKILVAIGSIG